MLIGDAAGHGNSPTNNSFDVIKSIAILSFLGKLEKKLVCKM
jgi:hypothetical protein